MSEEVEVPGEVPLVELLDRVPPDARLEIQRSPMHYEFIPVGRLCSRAATALRVARTPSPITEEDVARAVVSESLESLIPFLEAHHCSTEAITDALAEIDRLQAEVVGKDKVIEAVTAVIENGYPEPTNKRAQCEHGKFGWEECIACYDEALTAALNQRPKG